MKEEADALNDPPGTDEAEDPQQRVDAQEEEVVGGEGNVQRRGPGGGGGGGGPAGAWWAAQQRAAISLPSSARSSVRVEASSAGVDPGNSMRLHHRHL